MEPVIKPEVVIIGHVKTHHGTADGSKYSTVAFKSSNGLNFRLFMEGVEFPVHQKFEVVLKPIADPILAKPVTEDIK